jgi:hypothetical protein
MTGDDILKLAGELLARSTSPSEALCRNIVGRAYYAAYHMALQLFADLGLPKLSDHKVPVLWLKASGEPSAKKAGGLLEDLYAVRRRADYELNRQRAVAESRDLQFVKRQVEMAADVKSLLAACAIEPAKSKTFSGIQAYLQRTGRPPGAG